MFDYVIAIPSHKRSTTILKNTLSTLEFYGIEKKLIHIFVAPEEVLTYQEEIPDYQIIPSVLGLAQQRNFIRNYFEENQRIVYMDDDISGFVSICDQRDHVLCSRFKKGSSDYVKQIQLVSLKEAIESLFSEMVLNDVLLGGIYPVSNGFFCSHKSTRKLCYVVGCFYAEINRKEEIYTLDGNGQGEDYLRTLIHFTNQGIVRLNWFAPKTTYFKGSGGLNDERTIPVFLKALQKIELRFPTLCKIKHKNNFYPKLFLRHM